MSMNAYHCCMIFSNNKEKALKKLEEIYFDKGCPDNIRKRIDEYDACYYFNDEEWIWVMPKLRVRGFRAHKAYIDIDCTKEEFDLVIDPICNLYCNEIYLF